MFNPETFDKETLRKVILLRFAGLPQKDVADLTRVSTRDIVAAEAWIRNQLPGEGQSNISPKLDEALREGSVRETAVELSQHGYPKTRQGSRTDILEFYQRQKKEHIQKKASREKANVSPHQEELVHKIIEWRDYINLWVIKSPMQIIEDIIASNGVSKSFSLRLAYDQLSNSIAKNAWGHVEKSATGQALDKLVHYSDRYMEACDNLRYDLYKRLYEKTEIPIIEGLLDPLKESMSLWEVRARWPLMSELVTCGGDDGSSYLGEFIAVPLMLQLNMRRIFFEEPPNYRNTHSHRIWFKSVAGDWLQAWSGNFLVGLVRKKSEPM